MTRAVRSTIALAAATLVVGGSLLATASPAQAHNYLVSSTPAAGQTLTELPERFEITTNGPLLALDGNTSGFALEVRDAAGQFYTDGCVAVAGPSMTETAALGAAGTYTVAWQVVSSDGHTVSGEFDFDWAPAAGQPATEGSATPPTCNGTAQVGSTPPAAPAAPRANADLADLLWIGGAIAAILVAAAVTLLVVSRRQKRPSA